MPLIRFEELEVFKRAYRISLDIHRASLAFPKIEQHALADQIRRCSKGICANLAEGFAKSSNSKAELRRFLSMAIGSADEMRVWLGYCCDLEYITKSQWQAWRDEYVEIAKMLQGLAKSTARKIAQP